MYTLVLQTATLAPQAITAGGLYCQPGLQSVSVVRYRCQVRDNGERAADATAAAAAAAAAA